MPTCNVVLNSFAKGYVLFFVELSLRGNGSHNIDSIGYLWVGTSPSV